MKKSSNQDIKSTIRSAEIILFLAGFVFPLYGAFDYVLHGVPVGFAQPVAGALSIISILKNNFPYTAYTLILAIFVLIYYITKTKDSISLNQFGLVIAIGLLIVLFQFYVYIADFFVHHFIR